MTTDIFISLGIAAGLGMLVGMQRERMAHDDEERVAGIRTFTLITVMGAVAGHVSRMDAGGAWLIPAGLLAVAVLLVLGNALMVKAGRIDPGITTEVAALVMYGVGAALALGMLAPAVVTGGAVAVLLHWKAPLHVMVRRIGERDFKAIIQFVLIALVVLPVLPNRTFGPYEVFNPFKVWLLVVLIVAVSLAAYVAIKLIGPRAGLVLGGLLGGLVSSTAVTVSYARQTRRGLIDEASAATVLMLASTIVYVRVLLMLGVVAAALVPVALPPFGAMVGAMAILCAGLYLWKGRHAKPPETEHGNPAQLKTAMIFGGLYAVILFAVAATRHHLGDAALYAVAFVSGLTDMDAIALSTAQLTRHQGLSLDRAWRVILLASLANLGFKAAAAAVLGTRTLAVWIVVLFGVSIGVGAGILAWWP
jgi:uncharacterized membrane protein (DUF4010 family)